MEKIDWSKAPEGATHYWPGNSRFYEKVGDSYFVSGQQNYGPVNSPESWVKKLVARPSPAWSGVGIPAAGSICEVRQKTPCESSFDWEECRIAMINTGADGLPQVCTIDKRGDLAIYYPATDVVEFRPIRTPEQIAADERESAVAEMLGLFGGTDSRDTYLMQRLYDAGYRKMEQPK